MNKNKLSTEPYKGVRDFYPKDQSFLNYFTSTCRRVTERFGYAEYHASILEPAELYKAKGGENEEIIKEQSYTFVDRGGREVTLRPEMTPTVARMVAGRRRELGFPLRLFSIPNVFRYERPQRGRLREHWQLNVDLFGSHSPVADAEVITVAFEIMKAFGAQDTDFNIRINSRVFLNTIIEKNNLSEENGKKLLTLLDRRAKLPEAEFKIQLEAFGVPFAALSPDETPEEISGLLYMLKSMGVTNAHFDSSIVRGFDYYTGVVFEVFDIHPQNNRALFGGGRYDNLTTLFDDEPITGVGFGMGDVTMRDFLEVRELIPPYVAPARVYVAIASREILQTAVELAQELRADEVSVALDFGEKKLADQIKTASKQSIPYLIVVGDDEKNSGIFTIRDLSSGNEKKLPRNELAAFLANHYVQL
jgi:histidyl-tRNA synthetase